LRFSPSGTSNISDGDRTIALTFRKFRVRCTSQSGLKPFLGLRRGHSRTQ
jgi:hypothetical protein